MTVDANRSKFLNSHIIIDGSLIFYIAVSALLAVDSRRKVSLARETMQWSG